MEEINITPLSELEARQLTEDLKNNFSNLGERILYAYRRRIWEPLGYENFTSYTHAEFGLSKHESYSLRLNTLTTLSLLPELGEEAYKIPGNQKELLHKLPSEQRAEGFKEALQLAKNEGRDKPTANDVRRVIETKLGKPSTKSSGVSQSPKVSQNNTSDVVKNFSDNVDELREKLRLKTQALEITLKALEQTRIEVREIGHKLGQKVHAFNTVVEALNQIRTEATLLKEENKQLKKLLNL